MKKKHYPKKCRVCLQVYEKKNKDTFFGDTYLTGFPTFGLETSICAKCKAKEIENDRIIQNQSR